MQRTQRRLCSQVLFKKCSREPEAKDRHRLWWEDLLAHRPPELQKSLEGSRLEISKSISECWEKDDWLSQLDQACRNALIFEHRDVKIPGPRCKKPKAPDTAHISIEEVGRNLIKRVDGIRNPSAHSARIHEIGTNNGDEPNSG